MSYDRARSALLQLALTLLITSTAIGCVFFGESGEQDSTDTGEPVADSADDTQDDGTDGVACPDDCRLVLRYAEQTDDFVALDRSRLTLFDSVGLRAVPRRLNGDELTGCTVEWSSGNPDDAAFIQIDDASTETTLVPVAVAQTESVSVAATASCDQGEVSGEASVHIDYPEVIPTTGDGGAPKVRWWSARATDSVEVTGDEQEPFRWHTVDPLQDVYLTVSERNNAPSPTRTGELDAALSFSTDNLLFRRGAELPDGQRPPSTLTVMLAIHANKALSDESTLALVENCEGKNDQFRLQRQGGEESLEFVWDGTPYTSAMNEGLVQSRWLTFAMVFDDGEVKVYRNGVDQGDQPFDVGGSDPVWVWDSILRSCKSSSPDVTVELGDAVFIQAALGPAAVDTLSKTLLTRFPDL